MAVIELEVRVAALETEIAQLKRQLKKPARSREHWVDAVYGAFASDPDFLEAMRLGRRYRQSLRAKSHLRPGRSAAKRNKR